MKMKIVKPWLTHFLSLRAPKGRGNLMRLLRRSRLATGSTPAARNDKLKKTRKSRFFLTFLCLAKNWWPYLAIAIIVILCAYLKFWGLRDRLHFDMDETVHLQTIIGIYKTKQFVAQGPSASIGSSLYHGASYYYLYLFPTFISKGNPLSLAVFTIILSAVSVPLLYFALIKQFSRSFALTATVLYGFSALVISYSRWAWNPNSIPFFFVLALYSLTQLSQKRSWWLVVFAFSLSSISQLHIGAAFFTLIFLLMIPFLLPTIKRARIWAISAAALTLPWLPTIINEFKNNFALLGALQNVHNLGAREDLIARTAQSWNYFLQMYGDITRLPKFLLLVSLLCTMGALVFRVGWRDKFSRPLPVFIILSMVFSFLACVEFDGLFFTHFGEQLFVLWPIATAFFVAILLENKESFAAGAVILLIFLSNNWESYREKTVFGETMYKTEKQICAYAKDQNLNNLEIIINGKSNPAYIKYICANFYNLSFGDKNRLTVSTDFRQKTDLKVERK